jgi:hypothetical protein
MAIEYSSSTSAVEHLKDSFWQLMAEQEAALQNATYFSVTSDVARQCEERRAKITTVCQQIAVLRRKR